jgi:hypothetical protein
MIKRFQKIKTGGSQDELGKMNFSNRIVTTNVTGNIKPIDHIKKQLFLDF